MYLVIPKHKVIEGCVEETDGVKHLRSEHDSRVYEISGDAPALMPGRRMKVKTKKVKTKPNSSFRVLKVVDDEGVCVTR